MINVMMVIYKMAMDVLHNVKYNMDLIVTIHQVYVVYAPCKIIK
jgi:hypothetical protein